MPTFSINTQDNYSNTLWSNYAELDADDVPGNLCKWVQQQHDEADKGFLARWTVSEHGFRDNEWLVVLVDECITEEGCLIITCKQVQNDKPAPLDPATVKYREGQLERVAPLPVREGQNGQFMIVLHSSKGKTNYMNISPEEFQKIEHILLGL